MRKIIDFNKASKTGHKDLNNNEFPMTTINSIINSKSSVKVRILSEDIKILITLMFNEKKGVNAKYNQAVQQKNKADKEYWGKVKETLNELIDKLSKLQNIDSISEFSLMELDCLIGCIEEKLQDIHLNKLMMIRDTNPAYTQKLKQLYHYLLPFYENKLETETKNNKSNIIKFSTHKKTDTKED